MLERTAALVLVAFLAASCGTTAPAAVSVRDDAGAADPSSGGDADGGTDAGPSSDVVPAAGWLRQKSVRLEKGDHTILARIQQNSPPDTNHQQNYWLFRLRFRKRRKEPAPIGGLECGKASSSVPWR